MKYLLLLFFITSAGASTWDSYLLNKQALENFKEEAFGESVQNLVQALESEPMNPKIHLNLGMSLFAMGEPQKAAKAFSSAASLATNPEERFTALFNEAYSYGESKQVEKALESYQKALEIHPDSVEVKTNIELLLASQQNQKGQGEGQSDPNNKQGQSQPENSDGKGDQEKEKKDQGQGDQQQKKPKEFKSEELAPSDVKRILEELKSQEQGIRAKEYEKGQKERPNGKDW